MLRANEVDFVPVKVDEHPVRAATSRDVAALAGVAQSTVSAVINGKGVTPAIRTRVEDAMRKLRYQPNASGRTLRTSRTNVIALVERVVGSGDDLGETMPYIVNVIDEARLHDYEVVLNTSSQGQAEIVRLAGRAICDGFIIMDVQTLDDRVAAAAQLSTPVVLVGRAADPHGLDVVDFDTWKAAELLVDELAITGHRNIAMLSEPSETLESFRFIADFYDSVRERAQHYGLHCTVTSSRGSDWSSVDDAASQLLEGAGDRLGLVARTPRDTHMLMQVLQAHQLVPGRDVSLLSHCTDAVALSYARPITNVSSRPSELATLAAQLLFSRLQGDTGPARTELVEPNPLVRRATTVDFIAKG